MLMTTTSRAAKTDLSNQRHHLTNMAALDRISWQLNVRWQPSCPQRRSQRFRNRRRQFLCFTSSATSPASHWSIAGLRGRKRHLRKRLSNSNWLPSCMPWEFAWRTSSATKDSMRKTSAWWRHGWLKSCIAFSTSGCHPNCVVQHCMSVTATRRRERSMCLLEHSNWR